MPHSVVAAGRCGPQPLSQTSRGRRFKADCSVPAPAAGGPLPPSQPEITNAQVMLAPWGRVRLNASGAQRGSGPYGQSPRGRRLRPLGDAIDTSDGPSGRVVCVW